MRPQETNASPPETCSKQYNTYVLFFSKTGLYTIATIFLIQVIAKDL